jgi:hypothetical protein
MIAEYILVTLICTTMDKPCESYESLPMASEECETKSVEVLSNAQKLGVKETVLTYCTNMQYEGL